MTLQGHSTHVASQTLIVSFRDRSREIFEGLTHGQFRALDEYFKDRYENELDDSGDLARERNSFEGEVITKDASADIVELFESNPDLKELFTEIRKTILVGASDEYVRENVIGESWIAFAHYLISDREFNLTAFKNQDEIIGAISTRKIRFNASDSCSVTVLAEENAWLIESHRNQGYSEALIRQLYADSESVGVRIVEVDKEDERASSFAKRASYLFSSSDFYIQPKFEASSDGDNNTNFRLGIYIAPHIADSLLEQGLLQVREESFKIQGETLARLVESYARTFPGFLAGDIKLSTDGGSGDMLDTLLEESLKNLRKTPWIEFRA